jgi:hypothetical protein
METVTALTIGFLILAISMIFFFLHIHAYLKLLALIRARGIDIENLEPVFFDYGIMGFIEKLKVIEKKQLLEGALTKEEERIFYRSKWTYYVMAPFFILFMAMFVVIMFKIFKLI